MARIDEAVRFVKEHVQDPALADKGISDEIRNRLKDSNRWLANFQKVGDLIAYLRRFDGSHSKDTYDALKARGLTTFEDITPEVERRFGRWADDRTAPDDFIIGERYNSFQILIFVGSYDTRSGGMFVLKSGNTPAAVVIKATLEDGAYPNAWLEPHRRLKYYLKSRKSPKRPEEPEPQPVFKESFQQNAAILDHPSIPILTFVRQREREAFTYEGEFRFSDIHREPEGPKWFELVRRDLATGDASVDLLRLEQELSQDVEKATHADPQKRKSRLATAPKTPKAVTTVSTGFIRNPDVIAEVLERASGYCEDCGQPAPFRRTSDGTPYLEVHHRLRLADGGPDTVENAVALCPNCHRRAHFG